MQHEIDAPGRGQGAPRIISFERSRAIHRITRLLLCCPCWFCEELADEIERQLPLILRPS